MMGDIMDETDMSSPVNDSTQLIKELSLPLYLGKGWLKFLGVLSIIYGILVIFSIWGILICWLPIWMGILLYKAGNAIEIAHLNSDKNQFMISISKLKTYFTISGVMALIGLIFVGIAILAAGGSIFSLLNL